MVTNLTSVDWSTLPSPEDDGAAQHLEGMELPDVTLASTDGVKVCLSDLPGLTVIFAYPMTGRPDRDLPDNWDMIPGARGCTPQACAFRDLSSELKGLGVEYLYGLSTQGTDYQKEAADRLHLPFPLLSDEEINLAQALSLPTLTVEGKTLLKRLTLIADKGIIRKVFYPVFPPDKNADDVIEWLKQAKTTPSPIEL